MKSRTALTTSVACLLNIPLTAISIKAQFITTNYYSEMN